MATATGIDAKKKHVAANKHKPMKFSSSDLITGSK